MYEDPDFRECVQVAQCGVDWKSACSMDEIERKAFLYVVEDINGRIINWETGEVTDPPPNPPPKG